MANKTETAPMPWLRRLHELCREHGVPYSTGIQWVQGKKRAGIYVLRSRLRGVRIGRAFVRGGGYIYVDERQFLALASKRHLGRPRKAQTTL